MGRKETLTGHLLCLFSVVVWGTTFVSTKVLLQSFTPVEILFFRFVVGIGVLSAIYPKRLRIPRKDWRQELYFAAAGLCGITLYFLVENTALMYTTASNVGVISAVAPMFTALVSWVAYRGERPGASFFVGFVAALAGIWLLSFGGRQMEVRPMGDLLALLSCMVWACYSNLIRKINTFGYSMIPTTRRIFSYGVLLMIPALFFLPFRLDASRLSVPVNLLNLLYLGVGASALCFLTWNTAVKLLGTVKTSVYIYAVPVVTIATSVGILGEKPTIYMAMGTLLTLTGLFLSEWKYVRRR